MFLRPASLFLAVGVLLTACSPTFNWREVRVGDAGLQAVLPCKPDQASRQLAMVGREVEMRMVGCETGGALFAVSLVDVGDAARLSEAQSQWQAAMLAAMRAEAPQAAPYPLKGAASAPAPVRLSARGQRPDGSAVQAQAVWFAQGTRLYHAAVYAERLGAEIVDPFLAGLELP